MVFLYPLTIHTHTHTHTINYMCVQRVLFISGNRPHWISNHCHFLIVLDSVSDWVSRHIILHQEGLFGWLSSLLPYLFKSNRDKEKKKSWCCWLVWNNHFFQLKNFSNLLFPGSQLPLGCLTAKWLVNSLLLQKNANCPFH